MHCLVQRTVSREFARIQHVARGIRRGPIQYGGASADHVDRLASHGQTCEPSRSERRAGLRVGMTQDRDAERVRDNTGPKRAAGAAANQGGLLNARSRLCQALQCICEAISDALDHSLHQGRAAHLR